MLGLRLSGVSKMSTLLIGLNNPICVYGRIKMDSLVGEHTVYPLVNSDKYTPYQFAYWQLIPSRDGKYVVTNVMYV